MHEWPTETSAAIGDSDDFHIAVYHADGRTTGTLIWIWSVVVAGRVFVRAYNGTGGKWYRSALQQRYGRISAPGQEHEVEFEPVDDAELNARIDSAYEAKYAGSPTCPPMVVAGPKAATVEVAPRD